MRMQLNNYVLLHTFNFWIMRGEIDIFNIEDDIVEFGIHDTSFRVYIEQETYWIEEAVSFNSFTDTIQYEEHQETTTFVRIDTLECEGILYYSKEDICSELERILNEDK